MRVYHGKGREFFECCILILDAFPVHFGFLDAWVSADGFAGHVRDGKPNQTKTILASKNVFALDWVAGEKMGLDPSLNYVIQEAIYRWGAIRIDRRGNMSPWRPWTNVRPLTVLALDALEESNPLSRFASRAFASKGDPRFKPVSRWHWFFAPIQAVVAILERYVVKPRT
jgi:hypothetical protein